MKVVIINKSDSTGGAAVVSARLLRALCDLGLDAHMLVCEKLHDSGRVELAASPSRIKRSFLAERLKIFLANGLNRDNLFKVDTASDGLPLHRNRLVREADVICLNWVNQGMLSLQGLRELLHLGKPVVWTMHDMWNFTGICHHAGSCTRWRQTCGLCPFLGSAKSPDDISLSVWNNKKIVYGQALRLAQVSGTRLHFVAVSNWLAGLAAASPLMSGMPLSVIPNAFPVPDRPMREARANGRFHVLMGAARLDDPVKGLPILVEATRVLRDRWPDEAARIELVTFGNVKDPAALDGIAVSHRHLGVVSGEDRLRDVYLGGDAVVSTSLYETLPGTLVEGQVYGCIPVSFGRGGQADIIDHMQTGYIAAWSDDLPTAAARIAEGIVWAMRQPADDIRARMYASARARFDAPVVAARYVGLFEQLLSRR